MTLACMINMDEDALICDLAETYHIYDYRSLPCKTVAAFSCGLRDDSRIKMKIYGLHVTPEQMLLAAIVDNTKLIAWLWSEDGRNGRNRPKSLLAELTGSESEKEIMSFDSGREFDVEWKKITGGEK